MGAPTGFEPGDFTPRPVLLFGIEPETGKPVPLHTLKNALNNHSADVHTAPLNISAVRCTGLTTNPVGTVGAGSYSVTVNDSTNFPVGTKFSIIEGALKETVLFTVKTRTGDILTLDMRVGLTYSSSATLEVCVDNLASVAGSMASPQIYEITPPQDETWHICTFIPRMVHASAADDSKFGDLAELTNGFVFRKMLGNGNFGNFTNWKTNGDIIGDMHNVDYTDKAGGGKHGTKGKAAIKESSSAIIELIGSQDGGVTPGDSAQILAQDATIIGLDYFGIRFQGHREGK